MFEIEKVLLKRRKYALIALAAFLVMAAASYYMTVITVAEKSIFIYAEMNGYGYTILSLILSAIISALFGLYAAIAAFKKDINAKIRSGNDKAGSLAGMISGIAASGCPTCGSPILGLIGIPFGLASLPLQGIEVKALSVIFMLLSVYYISKNIEKNLACERNTQSVNL